MASLTRLWFMRHGEVEHPYVGTFVGSSDVRLSDVGRHQAQAIAAYLEEAPIDAIVSSPLRRALDTAAPLAKSHGLSADIRKGLAEMDFGEWEKRSWPEIEAADPDYAATWQGDPGTNHCPGGECANDFAQRIHTTLDELLDAYRGKTVALFAHAGTNRAILSHLTARPYMDAFVYAQDYGCVNAAAWDPDHGHGQVALINFVPGPRSAAHGDGGRRVEG